MACGAVAEWSKALAWKVSIRQNRIEGSNPSRSAIFALYVRERWVTDVADKEGKKSELRESFPQ